ncbi:UNVERIFIED_CONTAM: hypothetical protein Slati_0673600 [Sesamum latifolium]|uniref:Uncharacterized protein n=1 Tax=Sesamum latifolium TaxID=2727402 RepID=A0AAW2Y3Y4_9LAMI
MASDSKNPDQANPSSPSSSSSNSSSSDLWKERIIIPTLLAGAREFVRVSRTGKPDDLLNSVIGGFGSGAILGCLQGGQLGAVRYSVIFAVVGTAVDYATLKLKPAVSKFTEKKDEWLKLPEWSPIKVLDDEAVAAKRAREQQIYRNVHNLNKEES